MGSRDPDERDLTQVFDALRRGEPGAEQRLFVLVYDELHRMAHGRMIRESRDHTLQTTALVNEAYLRLSKGENVAWANRKHFFGAAGNAMRQILVDRARKRDAEIHGGKLTRVPLDEDTPGGGDSTDILALDEALIRMARDRPRHAEVVVHRFFLGLSVKRTAEVIGIAPRTVDKYWKFAKSWLRREMEAEGDV